MIFDKIYVINVERNLHKFEKVRDRIREILQDSVSIERIDAVDRDDLTEEWLKKKGIRPAPSWREPWSNRTFTKGDIACALSHAKAWEKIILDKVNVALLLEDDAVIEKNFIEGCSKIKEERGNDFDYIYLARNKMSKEEEEQVSATLVKPKYSYWCLASLISQEGARKLFDKEYFKNLIPSDEYVPSRVCEGGGNIQANSLFGGLEKLNAFAVMEGRNLVSPEDSAFENSETGKGEPMALQSRYDYINKELKLKVVTAATEETDGLIRLKESALRYGIPLKVLGIEKGWTGGNVSRLENPGGGQKINFLKEYLTSEELNDDDLIVFVDGYDVVFTGPIEFVLERYKTFNSKVVFAGERSCWPDEGLANSYPQTDSPYKYLNSGTFIGTVSELRKITEESILDTDDDQLYYSHKLLSGKYDMELDHRCVMFQPTEGCWEDMDYMIPAERSEGNLINKLFNTSPCIVHGNGSPRAKIFFNRVCDYISCNRLGYFLYNPIKERKLSKDYSISIFAFIKNNKEMQNFVLGLACLNNPKEKISIYICGEEGLSSSQVDILSGFKSFKFKKAKANVKQLDEALEYANEIGDDYTFLIKSNVILNNPHVLNNLIKSDKGIIAPVLNVPNQLYANFWRGVDDNGWYEEFPDYFKIVSRESKGVWNCPHVAEAVLIKKKYVKRCLGKFSLNFTPEKGDFITFCYNLRNSGDFVYADNREKYGYLLAE